MRVERVIEADDRLLAGLARLLPQPSPGREPPSHEHVAEIVERQTLLVARDDGDAIVGTLTLVVYRAPSGLRARIEDVIVDEAVRARGTGEVLTREAMRLAAEAGVRTVELTSAPEREAANRLYRRLGFDRRATNVYVWRPL